MLTRFIKNDKVNIGSIQRRLHQKVFNYEQKAVQPVAAYIHVFQNLIFISKPQFHLWQQVVSIV